VVGALARRPVKSNASRDPSRAGHLFTDSSLADYDAGATALARERALAFLDGPG